MTETSTGAVRYRARVFCEQSGFRFVERVATSVEQLRIDLVEQGITLVSAETMSQGGKRRQTSRFPLLVFCQQLLSLLEAGLQLVEAVDTLAEKELDTSYHQVLAQLQTGLRSGLSFSQALEAYPEIFPPLFQAAIEASEQTGGVSEALKRFVIYETQFQALRSRLVGALIYPALLLSLGGLVIAFLLGYVVPRFSVVFIDRLHDMPYLSGVVIRLGLSIAENPMRAGLLSLGVLVGFGVLVAHPIARSWVMGMAWRFPWLGERILAFELVRIYRSLGMLLRGGIPAVRSLQMIAGIAPLRSRHSIARAILSVSEGLPISVALHREGFTTVVSERLLAVGERSGKMGEMMERAADFLDTELERSVDRAVRLLEPLMMVVIGVLIGGIVMLMYLPIFELADSVR
ncbi:MAG: type II secretion system F family protein [Rhodoferax sp.]|nr:type II secretion system F family protein [Rhodoferax sp.]MDP3653829.1 type II secretion system F family protein [Rhodoferax sp.]